MPSVNEIIELSNNCTYEEYTYNGVIGARVTGLNGNSVFFPYAGGKEDDEHWDAGEIGLYWTGTYESGEDAFWLEFDGSYEIDCDAAHIGLPVRPVKDNASDED